MFGNNPTVSGLTFGKVLGGISKTLNIANQVIPLYQQAKPMINNAKTIMSVLKGLNKKDTENKSLKNVNIKETKTIKTSVISNNSPIFFQ